ncbi:MAG: hypothetical protein H3C47_03495 [Candidatus Cloacimonetes bacterium]|nr:hypothetical protein [Candidatus Cloacimonadota bacterium]
MDGVSTAKDLIRHFFEASNELLNRHSQAEAFFYSWLEVLEEELQFGPLLLHLPLLEGRQTYCLDNRLEESLRHEKIKEVHEAEKIGPWLYVPIEDLGSTCFMMMAPSVAESPIFQTFCDLFPFYVVQMDKVDRLGRRVKLLRSQIAVKKAFEDDLPIGEILDALREYFLNEHVFLYSRKMGEFYAPDTTLTALDSVRVPMLDALNQTFEKGDYLKNQEFHESIKALILYPLLIDEENELLLGSFSQKNRIISTLDFSLICDFALDTHNMLRLKRLLGIG